MGKSRIHVSSTLLSKSQQTLLFLFEENIHRLFLISKGDVLPHEDNVENNRDETQRKFDRVARNGAPILQSSGRAIASDTMRTRAGHSTATYFSTNVPRRHSCPTAADSKTKLHPQNQG